MSTVAERLAESWLDNQTERRYQPAFIQLLVSEGWEILHNTRHSPIEFGKDVIARSPAGELYAFQLKGNPASRLTKSQAQTLLPQLIELIDSPIPAQFRKGQEKHVSVLVTNGEVDEEAQLLINGVAARTESSSSPSHRFETWSRGSLLAKLIPHATYIWPSTLEGTRKILELYASTGREIPDAELISEILNLSVGRPTSSMTSAEKNSKLSSLLLVGEILKGPWYAAQNHYALFRMTVIVSVFGFRFADQKTRLKMVSNYAQTALMHCLDLLAEAEKENFRPRDVWGDVDLFAEVDIMSERVRLVADCAAALILSDTTRFEFSLSQAADLLSASFNTGMLWGQAAVPSAIARYWALRRVEATQLPDRVLASVLSALLAAARGKLEGIEGLPDPYFDFEDCWRRQIGDEHHLETSLTEDNFRGHTWFATPLLFMLAKRNWKQSCKVIWYSYSRVIHEDVDLRTADFFDATLSRNGLSESEIYYGETWPNLVRRAVEAAECQFLEPFDELAWILAAYVGIVPYRAWTNVLMWLDTKLGKTWYSKDHLPS